MASPPNRAAASPAVSAPHEPSAARRWIVRAFVPFFAPLLLSTVAYFVTLGPVLRAEGGQQDLFGAVQSSVEAARRRRFDVVFLGNSRVMRGINPDFLERSAHNFAFDDDTFLYYLAKARWLARTGHDVRQAFIGVDRFQLAYWNYDRYFAYRELLEDPELDRWLFDPSYGPALLTNTIEKRVALRFFYRNALLSIAKSRITGRKPTTTQFGESYELLPNGYYRVTYASRRKLDPERLPKGDVDERAVSLLEQTIAELRARQVDVVLFTPPACTDFREVVPPRERARFEERMRALASRHGARYVTWEADEHFTDDDFPDGTHLSIEAAERFSRIVSAWMQTSHETARTAAPANDG